MQAISKEYYHRFRKDKVILLGISFFKKHCAILGYVWNDKENVMKCLYFDKAHPAGIEKKIRKH